MPESIRIAIFGAGAMGHDHARYVVDDERTTLVAVADPMPEAGEFVRPLGARSFTDHRELLDAVDVDGVIIATPNRLHVPMARDVSARGIPVLLEKPISDDLDEALAFAAEMESSGTPVLVGHHRRHNPKVRHAKALIESGVLGRISAVSAHYLMYKPDDYYDVEWRRKPGAGPVLVNMVHEIDLLRHLVGEPIEIQALGSNGARGFEIEDSAVVNLRFENGALGSVTLSDAAASPWNWEATARENPFFGASDADSLYLSGTKGSLSLPRLHLYTYGDRAPDWSVAQDLQVQNVADAAPHRMQLSHFVDVIRGGAAPLITPADAARSLRVIALIIEAMQTRQRVLVTE